MSTVDAWLELAKIPDDHERVDAWVASYEASSPSIFDVYYSAWGDTARRATAALQAPTLVGQIKAAEDRARHLLSVAARNFRERGLLSDELHVVLLVGGHSSNGWVAEHNGRRTLFLALEYLGSPPYDDLLVVHELSHVSQGLLSPATRARTYSTSLAVMVEGAATAMTRALRPGHTDSAYLWMDETHAEWLDACSASASAIAALLLQHADTPDDADAVAPLLRNRDTAAIPPRSGYWAGDLIAREILHEGNDLKELLSMSAAEARRRVLAWASTQRA